MVRNEFRRVSVGDAGKDDEDAGLVFVSDDRWDAFEEWSKKNE